MLSSLDIFTLGVCSILASVAFGTVFMALWYRRRSERHLLHWGISNWLYAAVLLAAYDLPPSYPFAITVTFALMGLSDVLIVTGVYRLDDRRSWRCWMLLPILATAAGRAVPMVFSASEVSAHICEAIGLSIAMATCGIATVRQPNAVVKSRGQTIAGVAQLLYLPSYLTIIIGSTYYPEATTLLPRLPMLSDQLLLGVLNLGLLAIPTERAHQRLREQASRDALTGIWNRAGLKLLGAGLLQPGAAVFAIDIDHFKGVNDTHGHTAGDKVLIAVAKSAAEVAAEKGGHAFRTGGDEFIVILPDCAVADAAAVAGRLCSTGKGGMRSASWTLSIGVALIENASADFEEAIRRADIALYQAKAQGRDRHEIATV